MKELRRYYRQIRSWLPCGGKVKRTLMTNITATIEGYIEENPDIDFTAVQMQFGTPQEIASAFVDEMDTEDLLDKLRMRKKLVTIVTTTTIAIVILWAAVVTLAYLDYLNQLHGSGVTIIHP